MVSSSGFEIDRPALFTTRSTPPKARFASRNAAATASASLTSAVDAACLAFGGIDLVVNNAGLSISKPLLETTARDWDLQHDVMARGS
ncbi:MAG TPA: SDR family oxidoreductase, partial [Blastococcus sp.]|nr:SDR family oxidoreductase [Blastococcus sp.]